MVPFCSVFSLIPAQQPEGRLMSPQTRSSRRVFLKQAAGSSAAFAAPLILPRSVLGANDRVALGFVGVKNQGTNTLKAFLKQNVPITAIGDLDTSVGEAAVDLVTKQGHQA